MLALSSDLMREMTFDIETSFLKKQIALDNHIFVAGLARSGTTSLLNALHESNQFASLSYADMPFVMAPNLWSKLSNFIQHEHLTERAHGDGIMVSTNSPEAFEEVFWNTFGDDEKESIEKFKTYIACIINRCKKNRYLSKNNQNVRRLKLINTIFPNSIILIPFRDPLQHSNSLLNQHLRFITASREDSFISNYMGWIGHTEFGPKYKSIIASNLQFTNDLEINHWLEQWYLTYKNLNQLSRTISNTYFVCYESLCNSKKTWGEITRLADVSNSSYEFYESKKDISHEINPNILKDCNLIYEQLGKKSV